MASTISTQSKIRRLRFLILRSLFYKQALPKELLYGQLSTKVSSEISALLELQLILKTKQGMEITSLGRDYLYKLSGSKKPPMIDIDTGMLLPKKKSQEYIVRGSLAAEIFREVRNSK